MTSPLRRKRPITARGRNTPARTLASLAALALLLGGGRAAAQEGWRPAGSAPAAPTLGFSGPSGPAPAVSPRDFDKLPPVRRATYQAGQPGAGTIRSPDEQPLVRIQLEPPGPDRVFRLESEEQLYERMRQEYRDQRNERIVFPEEPVVSREAYPGRHWPPCVRRVEPHYVCYKNLYFQQRNFERYGWDLGVFQPIVSAGVFFADVAALPYKIGSSLGGRCCDCSAGECLPGAPVPLRLYPPEMSAAGAVAETGAVLALIAIFP